MELKSIGSHVNLEVRAMNINNLSATKKKLASRDKYSKLLLCINIF